MTYSAIRCPSCGSKSVISAEGKYYCRSCDGFFEKALPATISESQSENAPSITPTPKEVDTFGEKYVWAMLVALVLFVIYGSIMF